MNSTDMLNLLLKKHKDDICIPECKSGQSWTNKTMRKFDLWAMKRSYIQPQTWIYEIKVSRQDFLRDDKWPCYLPYCTDFYFAAPTGIIDVAELPAEAGLLLASKNAKMLYCKKKAPHRHIETSIHLLKYILMSRTKIVDSTYVNAGNAHNKKEYWKQWLAEKDEKKELGHNVSKKIRQKYDQDVRRIRIQQSNIEAKQEKLEGAGRLLKEIGFDERHLGWGYEDRIKARIAEINEGLPEKDIISHLKNAVSSLENTIKTIQDTKKTNNVF